ncbi:unnamed protein product [Meloidogyne enterolobii]|uniref:Uncharacterized protein n=1 Tax=Meloidogyne enterolobii TaxID=390850 RepID=A0ACB0XXZ5_MELEN
MSFVFCILKIFSNKNSGFYFLFSFSLLSFLCAIFFFSHAHFSLSRGLPMYIHIHFPPLPFLPLNSYKWPTNINWK